jgi:hypothetical protein
MVALAVACYLAYRALVCLPSQLPAQLPYVGKLLLSLLDQHLVGALSLALLLLKCPLRLFSLVLFFALSCPYLNAVGLLVIAGLLTILVCCLSSTNVALIPPLLAPYLLYLPPV